MNRLSRLVCVLSLLLPCGFVNPGMQGDGFKAIKERVVEYELSNGMKLVMLERKDAPVLSFINVVHVGSVNEDAGATGLAHMFEHLAFKGSRRIGTTNYEEEKKVMDRIDMIVDRILEERWKGASADKEKIKNLGQELKDAQQEASKYVVSNEFGEIAERNGASGLNAFTASDMTGFVMSVPSNKLELLFSLEVERLLNPVTREFYKERDVVKEERRMRTEDQPVGKLIEELLAAAYKAHPYGWPTVGHMSDLDNLTRRKALAFYKKYYVPNNMVLGIVGDIDIDGTIRLAEEYFGKIPRGKQPPQVTTVEPPQAGEKIVNIETKAQPIYAVAYHKQSAFHKDEPVFQCINNILGNGRTSRLYKRLVKRDKSAIAVGAFSGFPGEQFPNLYIIYAVTSAGKSIDEVAGVIDEEVERLKKDGVTDDELNSAKSRLSVSFLAQVGSNSGLASALASSQALFGDWRRVFDGVEKIKAVSVEDIKRVMNEYFKDSNRTVAKLVKTGQVKQ